MAGRNIPPVRAAAARSEQRIARRRRAPITLLLISVAASASSSVFAPPASASASSSSSSVAAAAAAPPSPPPAPPGGRGGLVLGVDGGTESIRARLFDSSTGRAVGRPFAAPYETRHPRPGWAEQDPDDWWERMGDAVRGALDSLEGGDVEGGEGDGDGDGDGDGFGRGPTRDDVLALCVDTTCCSVVALDSSYGPLRPCLLWMDARSAPQAAEILEKCMGDPALRVNGDGGGPLSAEWMTPKALWLRQNEPEVWDAADTICEYQDFINHRLTGRMVCSGCNAASRWHWDGEDCLKPPTDEHPHPGRPVSMYEALGVPELADKLPRTCLPVGSRVGGLTPSAALHLGLPEGLPVAQGGPDAFVGMIGLGCVRPGRLCLITGSSHLHCAATSSPASAPGTWGAYRGAPIPGLCFAEGGQSSTGSVLRWAKSLLGNGGELDYAELDDEASTVPPGCDGLAALETFQGSRTPVTDPLARGALAGLTLSHTRAHLWRALMEGVCHGTRACADALEGAGHGCDEIVIAGGATRSPLWLQMHADVTNRTIVVCECADAPLLGCAILAAVCAGVHGSVEEAVDKMVRTDRTILPDEGRARVYDELHGEVYSKLGPGVRGVAHAVARLRGGDGGGGGGGEEVPPEANDGATPAIPNGRGGVSAAARGGGGGASAPAAGTFGAASGAGTTREDGERASAADGPARALPARGGGGGWRPPSAPPGEDAPPTGRGGVIISPSLLAADWSDMRSAVDLCVGSGCERIHVDVFDGVFLDSPRALTFGPQMVRAIRDYCDGADGGGGGHGDVELDVHLCVDRPDRYVDALAESGASRVIFMWEGVNRDPRAAADLARSVADAGMACGVSVNPSTPVEEVFPLLDAGLVDTVDVLAVEPGFGGQAFQPIALTKLRRLRTWRDERLAFFGDVGGVGESVRFMVDGGVNGETAGEIAEAGADVMVAGTYLFRHGESFRAGVAELRGVGEPRR